ncbi:sigma-54-dependent Fis family transcriptional regulator [Peribacillus psychrosaccharolyticus]|uniref:Sigma-54-dependent Fis family transcriptional regulator n=2 Tax=Peribacillus psychrosaccharolyticus TaxID=1407 RepID=A0A974S1V2_PERPY|nr:sigma-54-dependent Fis family transcriptional regulator [Peribacillus psychrosaccharolyticus]MEC2057804.1 sigma-54-dependent Fis family transcriptional regulator [Peribacillus psychrosaccharolyticus]MED3746330.1 sigma-54-dependent Fis family transcriptional regulator [Peribacillus psychrosaccharolyticus]QQT01873.1 sigma-54-dependent Fis family transcriptional regulator [Peribacillus psychrosaccharolyticus]
MFLDNEDFHSILYSLTDVIDIGIHIIDQNGLTIVYNKKMSEIEGMSAEDVLMKEIPEVFKFHEETESTLIRALHHGQETKNSKQTYFNNRGQEITTINNTIPIFNQSQKVIGAIEAAKDISSLERLIKDNILNKGETKYTFESIIGESENFLAVIEKSKRSTRTASSILIVGETGTGKELFAQSIHNGSNRSTMPFISQNCAALPDSLIEGILFGTKKGAFTGSIERPGLFEQAHGGTILLDEINSLNPQLQAKLLRTIQERTIRRVGDTKDIDIDVRIIATINEEPIDAIANGHLRKDLYYRLSVVTLFIPPLRERKQDIHLLAQSFIRKFNDLFELNIEDISEEAYSLFYDYEWPGNVRELEHIIEGAMNLLESTDKTIQTSHLPTFSKKKVPVKTNQHEEVSESLLSLEDYLSTTEKLYLENVLKRYQFNVSQAAKALQISRQSLQYRLRKYQIKSFTV